MTGKDMNICVRYAVAVYVGLLLAGSLVIPKPEASANFGPWEDHWENTSSSASCCDANADERAQTVEIALDQARPHPMRP